MTGSPSALLERAAALIERVAGVTTSGTWRIENHGIVTDDESIAPFSKDGGYAMKEDLTWSVLMQPAVASPLVEWLRDAARRMEAHPHLSPEGSTMQRTALAFARIVLDEPE